MPSSGPRATEGFRLTPRDLDILRAVGSGESATAAQVATAFFAAAGGSPSRRAAYLRLAKLEAAGLLQRIPAGWRTQQLLRLTARGRATLAAGGKPPASRRKRSPVLTSRDGEIVRWITQHGVVSPGQVRQRFFAGATDGAAAAAKRLRTLEELGVLRRDRTPYPSAPVVVRATASGARMADVGLRPARLVPAEVTHALTLVDLVEDLAARYPEGQLVTEREDRAERWRQRTEGSRRSSIGRTPDGILTFPDGRVAIELDLTPKRTRDVEAVIRAYSLEDFRQVLWFCRSERVASRVAEIVRAVHADDYITVGVWPEPDNRAGR